IAPSTTNMASAVPYFNQMLQGRNLLPFLFELSYHRYQGVSDGALQSIADTSLQHGIPSAMLEHIGSGYEDLHNDLKRGRNSAWQQFTLAYPSLDDSGAQYYMIDDHDPNNPNIIMGSRSKFLRQYFKFIRSGAVRIEAATTDGNFDPLGFINRDGKYVVVVKAGGAGDFGIQGLPAGQYGINYTTDSQYDVNLPDATINSGQLLSAAIPSKGVITVYAKQLAPKATATYTRVPSTATKAVATKPALTKPPTAIPATPSPTPLTEQGAIATLAAGFGSSAFTATRLRNAPTATTVAEALGTETSAPSADAPTELLETSTAAPTNPRSNGGCALPIAATASVFAGGGFLIRRKSRKRK
ncbi:MAG TPA: hypothetical protein VFD70_22120, partial [Anaerolineae bacterium]|nr:hypothetical protein [Anaerolineae bacterium]